MFDDGKHTPGNDVSKRLVWFSLKFEFKFVVLNIFQQFLGLVFIFCTEGFIVGLSLSVFIGRINIILNINIMEIMQILQNSY